MCKVFLILSLFLSTSLFSNEVTYIPDYFYVIGAEADKIEKEALKTADNSVDHNPYDAGLNWGSCGHQVTIDGKKAGKKIKGFYLYFKNKQAPVEVLTFATIKSSFNNQTEALDKQGVRFTSKVGKIKRSRFDMDFQVVSKNLLLRDDMTLETALKCKY